MKFWHSSLPAGAGAPARAAAWRPWSRPARPWWWMAAIVLVLLLLAPSLRQRLDLLAFDLLITPRELPPAAVVIGIDEASLQALGPWPWPRELHARMLETLREAGATAVGYELNFPDSGVDLLGDERLAAVLEAWPRVVLPVCPVGVAGGDLAEQLPDAGLLRHVRIGHIEVAVDRDGVARRLYRRGGLGEPKWPSFPTAVAGLVAGRPAAVASSAGPLAEPGETDGVQRWRRADPWMLPPLEHGPTLLSFAEVLTQPAVAAAVQGRPVFVGVVAQGLAPTLLSSMRLDHTPVPSVLFQAQAYDVMTAGAAIRPLGPRAEWALTLALMAGMLAWPRPARSAGHSRLLPLLLVPMPLLVSGALLAWGGHWWAPVSATLALATAWAVWLGSQVRETAAAMRRTRREAHATLHAIGEAVVRLDAGGRLEYLNPVARRLASLDDARGLLLDEAFAFETGSSAVLVDALATCLRTRRPSRASGYLRLVRPDGQPMVLRATMSPLLGPNRRPEGVVIALADMTEAVEAANRLDHAATHDTLTGLPNRSLLADRLSHAIARAQRSKRLVALLFVDLDRFKRINDSLGHRHGDLVLQVTAQRLREACRANDTVIRWGGDEFVVLLEDLSGREAATIATTKIVEAVAQDIRIEGMEVPCTCSVGVALGPQDGTDGDALLAMADAAMYRAKSNPSERFQFFSNELNVWTRDRLAMESGLRQALADQAFELHYQPQFELRHHRLVGFEALLRWRRSADDLMLPGHFIGVAEESGLIQALGDWALRDAARQIVRWQAEGLPTVPVAINVSARQCMDHRIVRVLRETLEETGIAPHLLKLEITESTAMADAEHVTALLHEIRALGVGLAVDDFGTGYSSLSHLKNFPIDEIKIDRSFVRDIATDHNDAAIVRATIALAHGLGLPVVAEGVEQEAQRRFLARQRCDVMQGFLCGKPRSASETSRWMREERIQAQPLPRRRAWRPDAAYDRQRELWVDSRIHETESRPHADAPDDAVESATARP